MSGVLRVAGTVAAIWVLTSFVVAAAWIAACNWNRR